MQRKVWVLEDVEENDEENPGYAVYEVLVESIEDSCPSP